MRPVRYAIAALSAATLVVATVATVAAGRVSETAETSGTVHVHSIPSGDAMSVDGMVRVELVAGSDGERFLDIRAGLPDTAGDAAAGLAFRGPPSDATVSVDPSLAGGSVTTTFQTEDGRTHTLRAELRASGTPDQWTSGPYAVTLPGAVAALRTCTNRSVSAAVDISLDETRIPAAGADRLAELIVRTCSTVALYR
jgi:hypothetical protein